MKNFTMSSDKVLTAGDLLQLVIHYEKLARGAAGCDETDADYELVDIFSKRADAAETVLACVWMSGLYDETKQLIDAVRSSDPKEVRFDGLTFEIGKQDKDNSDEFMAIPFD